MAQVTTVWGDPSTADTPAAESSPDAITETASPAGTFPFFGSGDSSGDVLESLLVVYEQQGFRQGYRAAIRDLLASVVLTTEDFLETHAAAPRTAPMDKGDLRRLLCQFGQHLERHLQTRVSKAGDEIAPPGNGLGN